MASNAVSATRVGDFFATKDLLVTGSTGFLGKVIVEKVLRSIPNVGRLYLFMRPSTKDSTEKRFDEFLASPIFDRLRAERSGFDEWARSKLVLVQSDLTAGKNLGVAPSVVEELSANVAIVLHCAATVDFNERLDAACKINVLGTIELLAMAKKFRKLEAFVHVSTAYVNSNLADGVVNEQIYPMTFGDPAAIVEAILKSSEKEIEALTARVLTQYPNTYTFTKSLAEHMLQRHRGNVPIAFVRPTIIGCSAVEPVPGWIDAISAAAACLLFCGMGIITAFPGSGDNIADLIPVDHVSNLILVAAARVGTPASENPLENSDRPIPIYHSGTSERNPVDWELVAQATVTYWRLNPTPKRIADPSMLLIGNDFLFQTQFFLSYDLTSMLYSMFAAMQMGTNPNASKTARRLKKMTQRARSLANTFRHFVSHEWIFDASGAKSVREGFVSRADIDGYPIDEQSIHWPSYIATFCYGLQRFVLKERARQPSNAPPFECLISEDPRASGLSKRYPDVTFAMRSRRDLPRYKEVKPLTPSMYVDRVLISEGVRTVIAQLVADGVESQDAASRRARAIATRMAHTMSETSVRAFGFALRKIIRRLYKHVLVDTSRMEELRRAMEAGPVVLMPTHRSYLDFLILSYVMFSLDMPVPVICAGEDFLGMGVVASLLRNSGAFFIRRSFGDDSLYKAIFGEYVRLHVERPSHPIEFFVEGTRSRTGKSLRPRIGMLSLVAEPVMEGTVPDVRIFPVGISYDRIVETNLYANELMGVPKPKESAGALVRARSVLSRSLGRIHVRMSEPISVRDALAGRVDRARLTLLPRELAPGRLATTVQRLSQSGSSQPALAKSVLAEAASQSKAFTAAISDLSHEILRRQQSQLVATAPAIVAAVVLNWARAFPGESLPPNALSRECNFVRRELESRGFMVDWAEFEDDKSIIAGGIELMAEYLHVDGEGFVRAATDSAASGRENAIVLANWRNQLLHPFAADVTVVLAIRLAGDGTLNHISVAVDKVEKAYAFAASLLSHEIVGIERNVSQTFAATVKTLSAKGVLCVTEGGHITVPHAGRHLIDFLSGLITPIIDSYWGAALHLFGMLHPTAARPLSALVTDTQKELRALYATGKLRSPEALSSDPIKNAFHSFRDLDLLVHVRAEGLATEHLPYQLAPRHLTDRRELMHIYNSIVKMQGEGRGSDVPPERLLQSAAAAKL